MGGPQSNPGRLPRTVILLGWVSLFADVSGEMVYPLLPLFVTGVLNASATALGWIEGVAQAIVAVMNAAAGWRSDRIVSGKRRRIPYVRWGYGLPVIGKLVLALAGSWPLVMAGRTIDRLGKGLRGSPRDALIADAARESERGRAFGLHRTMDTAGAMIGVLIAAAMLWWLDRGSATNTSGPGQSSGWAFRLIFAVSAAMGLVSLALTFAVRESRVKDAGHSAEGLKPTKSARAAGGQRPGFSRAYWLTLSMLTLFSLANSSDSFLLLRASSLGLPPWQVVLAYALFNLTYTAVSYPAGAMSDRIGRWRLIGLGWAIYAVVYAGFALANAAAIWPLMAVYGVYMALTDGVGKALIADHAPEERRGAALGIFSMAIGLTTLASSVIAGILWDHVSHAAPFWFGAACATGALGLLVFHPRK